MRFVRVRTAAGPRIGIVRSGDTVALSDTVRDLEPFFGDDGERLAELGAALDRDPAGEAPLTDLELLPPVTPPSMRDFMVFEEHVLPGWRRAGLTRGPDVWYRQPIGYFSNTATLRGPRDPIEIPGGCERLDFELEIGAIVGRTARSATPQEASGMVAGYLVLCDWSARDLQATEMAGRLGPFKGKDFGSSLGPMLVTPDEIADRRTATGFDLAMTAAVNGRSYGTDRWASASWSFEELISYASWNSLVEPGALIGSGTCQGGCILELTNRHGPDAYPWLAAGDVVRLTVDRLGAIEAEVEAATRGPWPGYRSPQDSSEPL